MTKTVNQKPDTLEGKRKLLESLQQQNMKEWAPIMQEFGAQPNVPGIMIESLISFLEDSGLLSPEQILDYRIRIERKIAEAATSVIQQISAQKAQSALLVPEGTQSGKGIVLPGGGVHRVPQRSEGVSKEV